MKVYAVTYGGGHAPIAIKLAKAYRDNDIEYKVLAMPSAIPFFKKEAVPYVCLNDYHFLFKYSDEIKALGTKLAKKHHNSNSDIAYNDTIDYFGFSMHDLIHEHGEMNAFSLFNKKERKAFLPVRTMETILKYENPDIVQVTCGQRMERAAAIAARNLGILSYRIQDTPAVCEKTDSDYLFLINDDEKKKHEKTAIEKNRLIVTGNPAFEQLHSLVHDEERNNTMRTLNLKGEKIIVWTPCIIDDLHISLYRELCRIGKKNKEWDIVIKLHPTSHDEDCFNSYVKSPPLNLKVIKKYDVAKLLKASDVVITHYSTTGFEAILLNRPMIIVNTTGKPYTIDYTSGKASLLVDNLKLLEKSIKDCLYNDAIRNELEIARRKYHSSRHASQNVVNAAKLIYENNIKKTRGIQNEHCKG